MRCLALLLFASCAFGFQPSAVRTALRVPRGRAFVAASASQAIPLLDAISEAGVVGVDATEEQQAQIETLASGLAGTGDASAQARVPLGGTYDLLYSMSKGGSNGKVGPFTGQVTQIIVNEKSFINQVELFGGVVTVQLHAEREIIGDEQIRVQFVETVFKLFGQEVKRQPTKGQGVWEQLYVESGPDGTASLRVMRTPSLFILRQRTS